MLLTRVRFNGPRLSLIKVRVAAAEAAARVERVSQYASSSVERAAASVRPRRENYFDIREFDSFRERQWCHFAPHLRTFHHRQTLLLGKFGNWTKKERRGL